jgi:catalase-peroxidase
MINASSGVLPGRARALNANYGQSKHGVSTNRPETLTVFEGRDRTTDEIKWTGTRVDLVFGSNSQLRAIAEVYACDDSKEAFVKGDEP